MAPSVTVLTAVRNGSRYLSEAVESIRAQTFVDWEYVIVDDASDDDTPNIIERYARLDARIRLVRRETSGGPYAAANSGLDVATGRYVVRIDDDDVAAPDRIERQVSFLDRSELRACVGGWRRIDAAGRVEGTERPVHTASPRVLPWSLCVVAGVVHSSACIEREALESVGRYAELPTSADLHLWCALARRRWLGVVPGVVVDYRVHDKQITAERSDVQRHWSGMVLQEHLAQMTGSAWDIDQVRALRATGRWDKAPFAQGLDALDRWQAAWREDPQLSAADRRELRALTTRVRLRHVRVNARRFGDAVRAVASMSPLRSYARGR